MISILANIIKIVMLPSGSYTLLRVTSSSKLAKGRVRVHSPQKYGLVLIHPGVGEEERWIVVGDDGARSPVDMAFGFEEFDVGVADFGGRPLHWR